MEDKHGEHHLIKCTANVPQSGSYQHLFMVSICKAVREQGEEWSGNRQSEYLVSSTWYDASHPELQLVAVQKLST